MLEKSLLEFDKKHIWHPYTSLVNPLTVYPVKAAKGVYLELDNGSKLIDGMSSWWCAIHGYSHPSLNQAIISQLEKMSHVMFGGITHEPAIKLCQKLVEITPEGLEKVFLCDSGSVSVEVAIKMAFQYWCSLGHSKKSKLMTVRKGYHGDTFGAMSVCDPESGMHHIFSDILPQHHFITEPTSRFNEPLSLIDNENLEEAFKRNHNEVAAFILEPIVQGAGGVRMYSAEYLKKVKALCVQYDVLLILDEIATGFGRTGELFGANHADISPDIMCLGKSLTGGMMTLAATLCTGHVAKVICEGEAGVLMHGPTFMANPLACSVSLASINLLESFDWKSKIRSIEETLFSNLFTLSVHDKVKEVRTLGAIGVVECHQGINVAEIQKFYVQQSVWIRPFRNLIYLMPPFIIEEKELVTLCEVIQQSLEIDSHFIK
tara:strand:+ start:2934 stop:4229 length:1296 start_codon:yes stop_codon:yes gene_type:complete